jgi:hypothetical protein
MPTHGKLAASKIDAVFIGFTCDNHFCAQYGQLIPGLKRMGIFVKAMYHSYPNWSMLKLAKVVDFSV